MRISREKFESYLEVQASGLTNMFDVKKVLDLANKMSQVVLTERDIVYIMKNYKKLRDCYGIGGYNINIKSIGHFMRKGVRNIE